MIGTPEEVLQRATIESVFGARVSAGKNPVSMKPFILPLAGNPDPREGK
jgi:ABC-type hemin transport system ATPase subunit